MAAVALRSAPQAGAVGAAGWLVGTSHGEKLMPFISPLDGKAKAANAPVELAASNLAMKLNVLNRA